MKDFHSQNTKNHSNNTHYNLNAISTHLYVTKKNCERTWFVVLMRIDTGLLCDKLLSLQLHIIEKVKQRHLLFVFLRKGAVVPVQTDNASNFYPYSPL